MAWGVDANERTRLADLPGVASLDVLRFPRGRGPFFGFVAPGTRAPTATASVSDPVVDPADLLRRVTVSER
jgi:hypothetical protein